MTAIGEDVSGPCDDDDCTGDGVVRVGDDNEEEEAWDESSAEGV